MVKFVLIKTLLTITVIADRYIAMSEWYKQSKQVIITYTAELSTLIHVLLCTKPYLNHHVSCSSQSDPQREFNIITLHAAKMKHVIWMSLWNKRERRWNMFCQCSDKYKSILLAADTTIPTLSNNSQIYKQSVMLVIDTRSQTVYSLQWCYSEKLTASISSAMKWLLKVVN